ncbi:MAG: hypothetical protein ACE5FU_12090 [Nitrospinota bacterium]
MLDKLVPVKFGILFSLLTLLYGFALGGAFGAFEGAIKGHLKGSAEEVFETVYKSDSKKMEKISKKSWVYFKRAHLHANGLGVIALILSVFVALFFESKLKALAATLVGIGSLGYSSFWMFAGLMAPGMGSTGAAKESLKWLAVPSAAFCTIGLAIVIVLVINSLFLKKGE